MLGYEEKVHIVMLACLKAITFQRGGKVFNAIFTRPT